MRWLENSNGAFVEWGGDSLWRTLLTCCLFIQTHISFSTRNGDYRSFYSVILHAVVQPGNMPSFIYLQFVRLIVLSCGVPYLQGGAIQRSGSEGKIARASTVPFPLQLLMLKTFLCMIVPFPYDCRCLTMKCVFCLNWNLPVALHIPIQNLSASSSSSRRFSCSTISRYGCQLCSCGSFSFRVSGSVFILRISLNTGFRPLRISLSPYDLRISRFLFLLPFL